MPLIMNEIKDAERQSATLRDSVAETLNTAEDEKAISSSSSEPYTVFTRSQRAILVGLAAWSASLSGLSSNIYFPAIPQIGHDLHISTELVNLSVTLYLVFAALAPSLWASISDRHGRRLVLLATFVVYFGACIGLALTQNLTQLLVFRCLQSSGSASTVSIGAGMVGDIASREHRGGYMGTFTAGLLFTAAIGPVIGGVMAERVGWRSIFWLLTGYSGAFALLVAVIQPETLRRMVSNGKVAPASRWHHCAVQRYFTPTDDQGKIVRAEQKSCVSSSHDFHPIELIRPIRLLANVNVALLVSYLALHYASWQTTMTAMATLFESYYRLSELQIGLTYIANGAGCVVGSLLLGRLLDRHYRAIKAESVSSGKPFDLVKARLGTVWTYSAFQAACTLLFGWTIYKHVHLAVPVIATFFISGCETAIQTAINTFLVDTNSDNSASVTATLYFARCLLGAGATAVVQPMIGRVGAGWTFTIFTLLLLLSNVLLVVQMYLHRRPATHAI